MSLTLNQVIYELHSTCLTTPGLLSFFLPVNLTADSEANLRKFSFNATRHGVERFDAYVWQVREDWYFGDLTINIDWDQVGK